MAISQTRDTIFFLLDKYRRHGADGCKCWKNSTSQHLPALAASSNTRKVLLPFIPCRAQPKPEGSSPCPVQERSSAKPPSGARQHKPMVYFQGLLMIEVLTGTAKLTITPIPHLTNSLPLLGTTQFFKEIVWL